ncbi:MAG: hypothetical protein Q8L14_10370 [Myxococcales bacterium]|nr:hypothetical protein [Myxococcales bacterium]
METISRIQEDLTVPSDTQTSSLRDSFEPQGGSRTRPQRKAKMKSKSKANKAPKRKQGAPNLGFGESTGASLVRARRVAQERASRASSNGADSFDAFVD